ncbi:MAG: tRNA lysidine(34) synthetase TilS [Elusimicrobia bacterium]|jgi:tRNA(Ile)-lysidine synthase|nr:tRNA lysidine(34) synthetase TilS [Elusimicrobiota bacterium]
MNRAVQKVLHSADFNSPLVLAVSGGKDSVSMLDMVMKFAKKFKFPPEIVHFNHGLREESKEEEGFIRSLGDNYKIKVKIFKLNTLEFKNQNKLSTEEAARQLRYQMLANYTAGKDNPGYIYTGHNAGDQAETLLFRVITGTGRTGLTGIRDSLTLDSGWKVKRPLLDITPEEISDYAESNNLKYVIDKSNFDESIPRNYIRKRIVPLLKNLNPAAEKNIKKLTDILKSEEDFLSAEFKNKFKEAKIRREGDKTYIELNSIISYNKWIQRRLIRKVSPVVLDYDRINSIEKLITKGGASRYIDIGEGWKARKVYGRLVFEKSLPEFKDFFYKLKPGKKLDISPAGIILKALETSPENIDYTEENTEYFDMGRIDPDNIWVRSRKDGDRMSLFGMKGTKKIKDICIDLKLNLEERNDLLIIGSENKIMWAAPCRRSATAPVAKNTGRILKIVYERG